MSELKKRENESNEQYIFRVCQMKDGLGYTWKEISNIINKELGNNYDESCYRKKFQSFNKMFTANEKIIVNENEYSKEIQAQKDELLKIKKQIQDQRREYNKSLISDARADHLTEKLIEAANSLQETKPFLVDDNYYVSDYNNYCEAVLVLSDWHFGMVTDNIWNKYNIEICKERVNNLVNKVIKYIRLNNAHTLHILILGDLAHGAIHTSARVASEENVCDQLMQVSEILAEAISKLSEYTNEVNVYSTYGNHMRTVQNKNDSIHADNMEKIIPWWIKQRLKNNVKIHVHDNDYYEFIYLYILGHDVVAVHGDLDPIKKTGLTINSVFNKMYGHSIDYMIVADKHHLETVEDTGIESILVGSMCGTDEYANNRRLYSYPSQTLMMFNKDDGKYCQYNIKLA